jgi:hypothetical protein
VHPERERNDNREYQTTFELVRILAEITRLQPIVTFATRGTAPRLEALKTIAVDFHFGFAIEHHHMFACGDATRAA